MIFSEPQSDAAKRLVDLEQRRQDLDRQARDLSVEQRKAQKEVARLEEELTEAFAAGGDTDRLTKQLARAREVASQPWEQRIAGTRRAAQRLATETEGHIRNNLVDLAAELAPDCLGAAQRLEAAIEEVFAAKAGWHEQEQRFTALLQPLQGMGPQDLPRLRLDNLETAVAAIRGRVPPPVPKPLMAELGRAEG